jgi:hypothetical protein
MHLAFQHQCSYNFSREFRLEVKPSKGFDITAVYEALAHRTAATQSYVWLQYVEGQDDKDTLDRITKQAELLGVGLIIASDPTNFQTWETLVDPQRVEPDLDELNEFIGTQLSESTRNQIAKWM